MLQFIGIIIVIGAIFGGYSMMGGHLDILFEAAGFEMLIIILSATGIFIVSNSPLTLKRTYIGLKNSLMGEEWRASDYRDMLTLLYGFSRRIKAKGVKAIEADIEAPELSPHFVERPRLLQDDFARRLICDSLKMISLDMKDPDHLETSLTKQIDKHRQEQFSGAFALQKLADALPAIGIVVAILGMIRAMAALDAPAFELGQMIAAALAGTFMGVLLAYGLVAPLASRLAEKLDQDCQFYLVIKDVLVAHLQGHPSQISIEIGRAGVPTQHQPSFEDMEDALLQDMAA